MTTRFVRFTGQLDYAMFVVTTSNGRERSGCLVGFGMQCSIRPPRFLVGISNKNHTYRVIQEAGVAVVHLVPRDARDLAELFGGHTGDRIDKFESVAWRAGPGGAPILARCPTWFAGRIERRWDTGDHLTLLLSPIEAAAEGSVTPLMFSRAKDIAPGHEP